MVSFSFWKISRGEACEEEERAFSGKLKQTKNEIAENELLAEIKTLFFPPQTFFVFSSIVFTIMSALASSRVSALRPVAAVSRQAQRVSSHVACFFFHRRKRERS